MLSLLRTVLLLVLPSRVARALAKGQCLAVGCVVVLLLAFATAAAFRGLGRAFEKTFADVERNEAQERHVP